MFLLTRPRVPSPAAAAAPPGEGGRPKPPDEDGRGGVREVVQGGGGVPAEKQGDAVAAELKRRNPDFDGMVKATVENGVVTGLDFLTEICWYGHHAGAGITGLEASGV